MDAKSNAVCRATDYLRRLVAARPVHDTRLPTLDVLSRDAGVSRVTMHRAVKALVTQGALTSRQRSGIRLATGTVQPAPRPPVVPRSEQLTRDLSSDILDGAYKDSRELPSAKDLYTRYGVVFRTIRKALAALEANGTLRRELRRYRIVRPEPRSAAGHILLLIDPDLLAKMHWQYMTTRTLLFLAQLEDLCHDRRLRLVIGSARERPSPADPRLRDCIGAIVWASSTGIYELAAELARNDRPVVMVDTVGKYAASRAQSRRLTVLRVADTAAGAMLGRHLLALGHRRIGFFTYYRLAEVREFACRHEGVCQAFDSAGVGRQNVALFECDADRRAAPPEWTRAVGAALHDTEQRLLATGAPGWVREPLVQKFGETMYHLDTALAMTPASRPPCASTRSPHGLRLTMSWRCTGLCRSWLSITCLSRPHSPWQRSRTPQ